MGSKPKAREPAQKRRRSEPGIKKFAPLDGGIRDRRERGANPRPFRRHQAGKKFAPLNGGIRASEEWGANPGPSGRHRAGKSLLPWTEE